MNRITFQILCLTVILLMGCTAKKAVQEPQQSTSDRTLSLQEQITTSPIFSKSFTGFALYDPETDEFLESSYADKYFTPASNTKILTCFAGLALLPDSIPTLRYLVKGDSLIFWGTGDPSTLYSKLEDNSVAIDFLKSRTEQLFYAPQWASESFGPGWAWDDYHYAFSAERNAFPMYGNMAEVKLYTNKAPTINPPYFSPYLKENKGFTRNRVIRKLDENTFEYGNPQRRNYTRSVPFKTSNQLTQALLTAELNRQVRLFWQGNAFKNDPDVKTIYSIATDDVLSRMMKPSDNFVAEQLVLVCSEEEFGYFNPEQLIDFVKDTLLSQSPDPLIWVDGSGLSRYNLFTPRSIVYVLDKMRDEYGEDRLYKIFPVGGESGTIKSWYKGESEPYVFAKTGTMSNKHCLSGFLKTKSGKTLIFSFMHNNYITGSKPLKTEMEVILKRIHNEY